MGHIISDAYDSAKWFVMATYNTIRPIKSMDELEDEAARINNLIKRVCTPGDDSCGSYLARGKYTPPRDIDEVIERIRGAKF